MIDSSERQMEAGPLLLATKLYIPRARPSLLSRPRLLTRLDSGLQGPVTLIAAPTGSGKTALLTDWLRTPTMPRPEHDTLAEQRPVAWISLDPGDDDILPFLRYLVATCQTLLPSAENTASALL